MSPAVKSTVPTDFRQFLTVVRYEILKYLRSKRLLAMFIILFLVVYLILLVPPAFSYSYPNTFTDFASVFINFAGILILLCATFFGSDSFVSEFQQKTGFVIFPNPVKRLSIGLGKFAASMTVSILVMSCYYGLIALYVGGIEKEVTVQFVYSYGLALLYLTSVMSVAFFISSVMRGTVGSTLLTFFLFLLILPMIEGVLTFVGVKPSLSITFAGGVLAYILQVPYPVDEVRAFPPNNPQITIHIFYPEVLLSIALMVAYTFIFLLMALWIFKRKQMLG